MDFKYTINGNAYEVSVGQKQGNNVDVTVNGEKYNVELEHKEVKPAAAPAAKAPAAPAAKPAAAPAPAAGGSGETVKAPLPGTIIEVLVKVGDEVKAGQALVILEAMKMKNNIEAEHDGKVATIFVEPGQAVMEDAPLVALA